jgi:hypothetical protein
MQPAGLTLSSFSIPHSSFDILHFGVRDRAETGMKNVE